MAPTTRESGIPYAPLRPIPGTLTIAAYSANIHIYAG
jgi:hypothetical protein